MTERSACRRTFRLDALAFKVFEYWCDLSLVRPRPSDRNQQAPLQPPAIHPPPTVRIAAMLCRGGRRARSSRIACKESATLRGLLKRLFV